MQYPRVTFVGSYMRPCSHCQCFYRNEQLNLFLSLLCACYYFIFLLVLRLDRSDSQLPIFEELTMHSIFTSSMKELPVLLARSLSQEVGEAAMFDCSVADHWANTFYFYFVFCSSQKESVEYK